LSTCNI